MRLGRRRRLEERADSEIPTDSAGTVAASSWTMGSQIGAAATTALLWIAIMCGPFAAGFAIWQITRPAPVPVVETTELDPEELSVQLHAEEFAVRVITTWLGASHGQEDLLKALLPQAATVTLPAVGMSVSDPMVVESQKAAEGVWSITVAATVTDTRMQARRFFSIPVKATASTAVAVALPREVAGTLLAQTPAVDYRVAVVSSSPLHATAAEFLNALLVGRGDVDRLIAPNVDLRAVTPAPFTEVAITRIMAHSEVPAALKDGATLDVLVTATAKTGDQQRVSVQYPLTLVVRAARWEVAAIRDLPLLPTKSATTSPSPSEPPAATVPPSTTTPNLSAEPPTNP